MLVNVIGIANWQFPTTMHFKKQLRPVLAKITELRLDLLIFAAHPTVSLSTVHVDVIAQQLLINNTSYTLLVKLQTFLIQLWEIQNLISLVFQPAQLTLLHNLDKTKLVFAISDSNSLLSKELSNAYVPTLLYPKPWAQQPLPCAATKIKKLTSQPKNVNVSVDTSTLKDH